MTIEASRSRSVSPSRRDTSALSCAISVNVPTSIIDGKNESLTSNVQRPPVELGLGPHQPVVAAAHAAAVDEALGLEQVVDGLRPLVRELRAFAYDDGGTHQRTEAARLARRDQRRLARKRAPSSVST